MATKKRQVHNKDELNGKSSSSKASTKNKHVAKIRTKEEDSSKGNVNSVLYKICLFSLGKFTRQFVCSFNHIPAADRFEWCVHLYLGNKQKKERERVIFALQKENKQKDAHRRLDVLVIQTFFLKYLIIFRWSREQHVYNL